MNAIFTIFRKEVTDAMRDRRTLLMVLFSALIFVPLLLLIFSEIMSQIESQEDKRTVLAVNIKQAPRLENFILRQGYQIETAPSDYEDKLRKKELSQPVLLVPEHFEDELAQAKKVSLQIVFDTSNKQAEFGLRPLKRLLDGYTQESAMMALSMRGVSAEIFQLIEVREKYIGRSEERRVTVTSMLPFALIMAIVVGGMFAAIDTTAGERERGSLEPLMMNPVSGWQLALGKWGAVASISMLVAILTVLSFFPAQWLIRNDALKAEFQFAGLQVALSLTCKSFKEAQVRMACDFCCWCIAMAVVGRNVGSGQGLQDLRERCAAP
ncbi:ABC transporter permease [Undibacterium piscinae]|uniref:ABC transporter permease n=1 Tax=Undibacterium piscinae TaxID=2495591 RepID=A0A6M4A528_9BURK|nr:ABC transporter permease [Undibacterium piscinae]